ncbi:TPM domain-containing protein [Fodinibius sp. AD559]|uniref:TPM domain-containing protein n=1 Tax=Fodinibius sp. AD559 TaxID=3424179 RepID=UPI004046D579
MFSIKRTTSITTFLIVLFLLPNLMLAQDLPSKPVGHVNDFAKMLTSGERQQLEQKLRNYRDTTTTVISIATLDNLGGISIEEAATTLFNDWKMWEDNKDNGVLILIAQQERKMRIEVGYGLEGAIPDVMAGRIIREILTPSFKNSNYYGGLDRATSALIQLASGEFEGQLANNQSSDSGGTADFIIFMLFLFFVFYASSRGGGKGGRKGKRRRTLGPGGFIFLGGGGGFGGSSSGGGFGGFSGGGGFGSGGGGASGGW